MKAELHNLHQIINNVRKSNDLKLGFWYIATTSTFLIYKILRFLNYQ